MSYPKKRAVAIFRFATAPFRVGQSPPSHIKNLSPNHTLNSALKCHIHGQTIANTIQIEIVKLLVYDKYTIHLTLLHYNNPAIAGI